MKRTILFLFLVTIILHSKAQQSIKATNVHYEGIDEKTVQINYDLPENLTDELMISIKLKNNNKPEFEVIPKTVSGSVGKGHFSGKGQKILWMYLVDVPNGIKDEGYLFDITVEKYDPENINPQDRMLDYTMHTGQKITVYCPTGFGGEGKVKVHKGVEFLSASYPEIMTADILYAYNDTVLIKTCADLTSVFASKNLMPVKNLILKRNGQKVVYPLPLVKQNIENNPLAKGYKHKGEWYPIITAPYFKNYATYGINVMWFYNRSFNIYGINVGGIINQIDNKGVGVNVGGLVLKNNGTLSGINASAAIVSKGTLTGINASAVTVSDGEVDGLSCGALLASKDASGVMINGIGNFVLNRAKGVMIGTANYAKELHGFQIGLINIAENNKFLKVFPIFNFHFGKH